MRSLFHLLRFATGLDAPASQVTDRELRLLKQYARDASVICEIGCYEGRTSVELALGTKGTVYSVDPFFPGRLGVCYTEWIARIHRSRRNRQNLVFLKGLSSEIAQIFNLPIDFLFIDADHSYEAVSADWAAWIPKVVTHGYVALHDSKVAANSPEPVGSMRFYSEDIQRMTDIVECDSIDSLVILRTRSEHISECIHEGGTGIRDEVPRIVSGPSNS